MEMGGEVSYWIRDLPDGQKVVYLEQGSERLALSFDECKQAIEQIKESMKEAWPSLYLTDIK
jgi:hypothetical protein